MGGNIPGLVFPWERSGFFLCLVIPFPDLLFLGIPSFLQAERGADRGHVIAVRCHQLLVAALLVHVPPGYGHVRVGERINGMD